MNQQSRRPAGIVGWLLLSAVAGAILALSLAACLLATSSAARLALFGPLAQSSHETRPVPDAAPVASATAVWTSPPTATIVAVPTLTPAPQPTPAPDPTATASPAFEQLLALASRGLVTVINAPGLDSRGEAIVDDTIWGSGVIVDQRGYLLTNLHVVSRIGQLVALGPEIGELPASFVAGEAAVDLALLRLNAPGSFPVMEWGDSRQLQLGQFVAVLGTPLGNLPGSVTTGVISGLNRVVSLSDDVQFTGLIQTDAAINHGNSGGALLNASGQLVGIVSLMLRDGGVNGWSDVQGIGFAIPAAAVRPLVDEWIALDNPNEIRPHRLDGGR